MVSILSGGAASVSVADDWPQWRGPDLNGVSRAKRVPTTWSDTQNVRWRTALPCWSGATPIVAGEVVFVTSPAAAGAEGERGGTVVRGLSAGRGGGRSHPGGERLLLLCIDRKTGALRWERQIGTGNKLYGKQNMSSPSPVSDGRRVWALTGTGVLTAFDIEGKELWRRDLAQDYGAIELMWGYASSPLLHEGRLIVPVMQTGAAGSYLAAFDAATGKTVWKLDRKTDAENECPDAYTTPILASADGRVDVVVSGADWVTGHDPATGAERWRATGLNPEKKGNYRIVASPVFGAGLILAPTRVRPMLAIRAGGSGDVSATHVAWKYDKAGGPDVPTPTCDGKYFYLCDDKGLVTCIDPKNGERVWGPQRTASGTVSASPVIADGKLFVTNELGVTTVLATGAEPREIAVNDLKDEYTISTPAICDGEIFIRTSSALVCIGE